MFRTFSELLKVKKIFQTHSRWFGTFPSFVGTHIESVQEETIVKPFRVSVEGNIAVGKSTFINHFCTYPDVDIHMEPVSEWCSLRGHNLLELLYKDLNRWNFMFQNYVQLSRLKTQMHQTERRILMFERSLQNNRFCFVEMAHSNGQLRDAEYVVLCKWYDWIKQNFDIRLDLIVYLRSSPEVCYERNRRRSRPEEITVSLSYLKELHESYEQWLLHTQKPAPVLVIDANKELDEVRQLGFQNQSYILGHCNMPSNPLIQSEIKKTE